MRVGNGRALDRWASKDARSAPFQIRSPVLAQHGLVKAAWLGSPRDPSARIPFPCHGMLNVLNGTIHGFTKVTNTGGLATHWLGSVWNAGRDHICMHVVRVELVPQAPLTGLKSQVSPNYWG